MAEGCIDRTVRARFSLDETFAAGEDTGTPVIEDYAWKMPFRFTGKLNKFVINLGQVKLSAADWVSRFPAGFGPPRRQGLRPPRLALGQPDLGVRRLDPPGPRTLLCCPRPLTCRRKPFG